jgi:hypothetical protein
MVNRRQVEQANAGLSLHLGVSQREPGLPKTGKVMSQAAEILT